MIDWPSKFGATGHDLLSSQKKAFGLSGTRHGGTFVLKFSGTLLTLSERRADVAAAEGGQTKYSGSKEDKNSRTHFI